MKKKVYGLVLAFAGAVLMCVGIAEGEPASVFSKAIRICLECIGIG